jgi:hypothetical protein
MAIQPRKDSAASIKCQVLHVKLSDRTKYEALSYMWGPLDRHKFIAIDTKGYQMPGESVWGIRASATQCCGYMI